MTDQIFATDFSEKVTPSANDKILLSDVDDAGKIKYGKYSKFKGEKGDTGATPTSAAIVGDDIVFTKNDGNTVTISGAVTTLKGTDGREIELQSTATYIQWRYVGEASWTNLIALSAITGADGTNGTDGKYIVSGAFVGNDLVFTFDDTSTVIITNAAITLKGATGENGTNGTNGAAGKGITSITKTGTLGLVDTYTITYSDSTTSTFEVTNGQNGANGTDGISLNPMGPYDNSTTYAANDIVSYLGSSWIALQSTFGNIPSEGANWTLNAAKGTDGTGAGDISGSGTANEIAYFTAEKTIDNLPVATYPNLTEFSYVKGVTSDIQTQLNGKQASMGADDNYVTDAEKTAIGTIGDKVDKSTYDANSILYATTDNTPVALTVGTNTVVGRVAGAITTLAIDSDLSSVSANDDTIPSAKAAKAMGDSKLPLAGGTMTGPVTADIIQLVASKSLKLAAVGITDQTRSGITEAGTGGETLAFGELCYFKAADSKRYKAKADVTATSGAVKLGMCVLAGASTTTEILLIGKIRADSLFPTLTIGGLVYASAATAGVVTPTQPTGTTGFVIRTLGHANSADELYFNPSNDYIEI